MKCMNTKQLTDQCQVAKLRGYKRYFNTDMLDLDPEGVHCIGMNMLIEQNNLATIRCEVMVKLRDDENPHILWLDLDVATFNLLKDVAVGV